MSSSAQTIRNIISLNLKTFARQKGRITALLAITATLCLAAGLAGNFFLTGAGIARQIPVAIVDLDESAETLMIISAIMESPEHGALLQFSRRTQQDAATALEAGSVVAVITLPENFGAAMTGGRNIPFAVDYNRDMPLMSALVRVVADSFADMLRSSQTGVYVTLNYAALQELPPYLYNAIFMGVNMRFLGLVMNRSDMFAVETQSVTGGLAIWQAYFMASYIALMMCFAFVMTDAVRLNFRSYFLLNLALRGVSPREVFLACAVSYLILIMALNAGLWLSVALISAALELPAVGLGFSLLWGITVVAAVLASFAAMLTFVFSGALSAGIFTAAFTGVSLFLSGGIIPVDYFSQGFRLLSNAVFNTWGVRLFSAALTDGSLIIPTAACAGFTLLFSAIGCTAAGFRGRV